MNTSQKSNLVPLGDRGKKNSRKHAPAQKSPQVATVEEDVDEDQTMEDQLEENEADKNANQNAAPGRGMPHPHNATNDGTHRLTIQWTAPTDVTE